MTVPGFPGGYNTFVPSFDASGQLVVNFSRNPKDFPLLNYVTITPVKKSIGYFLRITPQNAARIINSDIAEAVWDDGNDAPTGIWNTESHLFVPYTTTRYAFPFRLGYKTVDQADWKIVAQHAAMAAQQAMTARSYNVIQTLQNSALYGANTNTATNICGGFVNSGDPGFGQTGAVGPRYKKLLNNLAQTIQQGTLGAVKPKDLIVVIDPVIADALGRSAEIHAYMKESPAALAQVRGDVPSQNGTWGIPDMIYGYRHVVEDTVRTPTRKNTAGTASPAYAWGGNSLVMLARPGGLTGFEGSPSFSSLHLFMYEEMTVEQRDDPNNRRIDARVVEDYDIQLVAPVAAYLVTHALS